MSELVGRVAVVTGGTRGIGKVVSAALAAAGAHVVVGGRAPERGERTAAEIVAGGGSACFVQADLTNEAHAERLVAAATERFGGLDIVVNNAAATDVAHRDHPVAEETTDDFEHFLGAGLRGAFWMFKYGAPAMAGSGAFVTISSLAALMSRPSEPGYAAAKGGLTSLARQVAVDYGPLGVRSNSLVLGFIRTNASAPLLADDRYRDALRDAVPGPVPEARDVAAAVVFLAGDAGRGFNGATLVLDGGLSAKSPVPPFE